MLSFGFRIFCWYRGFCHRTGSDLLLFLFLGIDLAHRQSNASDKIYFIIPSKGYWKYSVTLS